MGCVLCFCGTLFQRPREQLKILVGAILLSDRDYILRMLKSVVSVCLFRSICLRK